MSLTIQQKEKIFQKLMKQYGFVQSRLADDLYVSKATGALLYWNGEMMELSFGLCEKFQRGEISIQ
jgi:hypothetical protein